MQTEPLRGNSLENSAYLSIKGIVPINEEWISANKGE
jgi:hypothetical protein